MDDKMIATINANDNIPVVITGICDAMSLSVARSLGKKNIPVIAVDCIIDSWYAKSKYLVGCVKCDSMYDESLITTLISIAAKLNKKPILINCTDQSVFNASNNRIKLENYYITNIPSHVVLETLINKKLFYRYAENNFLDIPKTYFTNNYDEIKDIGNIVTYPCIIKPECKNKYWQERVVNKVILVYSKHELHDTIQKYRLQNESLIFQEWIEGDDTDLYFCLCYISKEFDSSVVITGKKLRQHPHLAGTLSIAESVWVPEIALKTLKLFKTIGCSGFCSVEYKKSKIDGKYYIIEPTVGRPDSQEEMAVKAGLDIPYLAYWDMAGRDIGVVEKFEENIKWIDEPRMYYTLRECVKGSLSLSELFNMLSGKRSYALFDTDDLSPSKYFFVDNVKKLIKGLY